MWSRIRPAIRDLFAGTLYAAGITRPGRRGRDRLTIVTFHRVLPPELRSAYPLPGLAVTPEELDGFLCWLARHYECGTLSDAYERWRRGDPEGRPRLALTFDDAYLDNVVHARPVLERRGVRATFFAPAGLVERGEPLWHDRLGFAVAGAIRERGAPAVLAGLGATGSQVADPVRALVSSAKELAPRERAERLRHAEALPGASAVPDWARIAGWDGLRELVRAGHEVGSHSLTHPLLPQCTDAEVEEEVGSSRRLLELRLEAQVKSFCYPNGDHDARTRAAVERAGYLCSVATEIGLNGREADPLRLRRIELRPKHFARTGGSVSPGRAAWRLSGWAGDGPRSRSW